MPPIWFPFVSTILLLIAIWYPIHWLLSHVDGWGALAQHYRLHGALPAARQRFARGRVGSTPLSDWLEVAARAEGLYLAMLPPFHLKHPPLLIPWNAITHGVRQQRWLLDRTQLFVQVGTDAEPVPITLESSLLDVARDQLPPIQSGVVYRVMSWQIIILSICLFILGLLWTWGVGLGGFFL